MVRCVSDLHVMNRTVLTFIILFGVGIAAAAIVLRAGQPAPLAAVEPVAAKSSAAAGTAERLAALEAAVAEERRARQLLEDELLVLFAEMDRLRDGEGDLSTDTPTVVELEEESRFLASARRGRSQASAGSRTEALMDAGFSPERAAWIRQREDELRVEAMQARFEAQRSGDMQAMFGAGADSSNQLRAELGDAEYEQYLEAYDRPTAVTIGNVLESSPGAQAGLQRGDEIIRYDGQRVFNYTDINEQQLQGTAGENVVVDIRRDGMPMQIVLPRGPIGIEAGRRWGR